MAFIFSIIAIIVYLLLIWGAFVLCLGICGAVIRVTLESPIFWAAIIGGLIAFVLGYRSDSSIITGMILGGGTVLVTMILCYFNCHKLLAVLGWIVGGWVIGYFLGMTIFLSVVGGIIGIWRVCR